VEALVIAHLCCTWGMIGVMAVIDLVHYPLFARVGLDTWTDFHNEHSRRMLSPLAILWTGELLSGIGILALGNSETLLPALIGIALTGATLGITAFMAVPRHQALAAGFDAEVHRSLMSADRARFTVWCARGAVAIWLLSASSP